MEICSARSYEQVTIKEICAHAGGAFDLPAEAGLMLRVLFGVREAARKQDS